MQGENELLFSMLDVIEGQSPRVSTGWELVESHLNVHLPNDYKQFVDVFGVGDIFEHWGFYDPAEWICSDPFSVNAKRLKSYAISMDFRHDWFTFDMFTASHDGILSIGADCNGGELCLMASRSRDRWPIVIIDRDLAIVEVVYASLQGLFIAILKEEYRPQTVHQAEYWNPQSAEFRRFRRR